VSAPVLRRSLLHLSLIFAAAPTLLAGQTAQRAAGSAVINQSRALVTQYCVACHNDKLKTAGVSLENLDPAKPGPDSAVWEKVLRKVASNQMPPAGLPRPDAVASQAFTTALRTELDQYAAAPPDPGRRDK